MSQILPTIAKPMLFSETETRMFAWVKQRDLPQYLRDGYALWEEQ